MLNRKRCLIVQLDDKVIGTTAENMEDIRKGIIRDLYEGLLVLPPWCTATVADIDIADILRMKEE